MRQLSWALEALISFTISTSPELLLRHAVIAPSRLGTADPEGARDTQQPLSELRVGVWSNGGG